jgi:hypothetical protein
LPVFSVEELAVAIKSVVAIPVMVVSATVLQAAAMLVAAMPPMPAVVEGR